MISLYDMPQKPKTNLLKPAKSKNLGTFVIQVESALLDVMKSLEAAIKQNSELLAKQSLTRGADGLLAAFQAGAANDSNKAELKQLGQWVFEGCDPKWQSAAVDGNGRAWRYQVKRQELRLDANGRYFLDPNRDFYQIDGVFDSEDWQNSAIDRETVNDVDYLSERKDFEACVLSDEDMNDVDAALTLSIEDLERVFIQNLSNLLIQRMHSLERFSAPDQKIGIKDIKTWDLVFDKVTERFGLIVDGADEDWVDSIVFPSGRFFGGTSVHFHTNSFKGRAMRTVTEDELGKCRKAMEAAHA